MGKPAARLGDMGSNHGAWHPSPITAGSGDVLTNGIPAARKGDSLAPHVKPKSKPHGRAISAGSSSVFINGKPAARVDDAIDCGGTVAAGSGNVFIGDEPKLEKPIPPEKYIGEYKLYKTDNRPFDGYYYEVRTLGGKLLGKGVTNKMGHTQMVETEMSQRVKASQSLMRESERITENWGGKLDAAIAKAQPLYDK